MTMRRIVTSVFQKDPELKGSHSLLIFGICKTRHPDKSLKGNTEREREGGLGVGDSISCSKNLLAALLRS